MVKQSSKGVVITFPLEFIEEMETYCCKLGVTKTALVNMAVRQYMQADSILEQIKKGVTIEQNNKQ